MITQILGIICLLCFYSNEVCASKGVHNNTSKSAVEKKVEICATCHNKNGISTNSQWPNIAGQELKYLIKQITQIRDDVRSVPTMHAFVKSLSDKDIIDIAKYFSEQQPALGVSIRDDNSIGKIIFLSGSNDKRQIPACAGCHNPIGIGIKLSNFPSLSGQHAEYLEKQLMDFKSSDRTNDDAAVMRNIAKYLTNDEIKSLADYISGLRAINDK